MEEGRGGILDIDVAQALKNRWLAIAAAYRKAFVVCIACNVAAYFIFISHYLMHNHYPRFPWIYRHEQLPYGRWFTFVFHWLTGYASLPVLQHLVGIVLFTTAALMALAMWRDRPLPLGTILCTALAATLYPANLAPYYFTWYVNSYAGAVFLGVLALRVASSLSVPRIVLGAVLATLALASYQISLSVMATVFMALVVLRLADHEGPLRSFWATALRDLAPRLLTIVLGGLGYMASLPLFGLEEGSNYILTSVPLELLPFRLVYVAAESVSALFYTQPDIMLPTRTLLLAAVAAALALLVGRAWSRGGSALSRVARAALVLAAFLGLVVATKAMYVVSASNAFAEYRYNLSLGYFHAFCVFVLLALARPALVRGVALGFVVVLLVLFAQSDLLRQGVLLRGQEHDLALANRVLYRIESLPDLDLSREYFLVRVGHYPRFRMNAMRSKGHGFDRGGDTHMDSGEITALWSPSAVMDMLGSKVRWKTDGGVLPDAVAKIREARSLCLDQGRKPWPDASSVFIHGDWVVVYMEESGRPAAAAPSGEDAGGS